MSVSCLSCGLFCIHPCDCIIQHHRYGFMNILATVCEQFLFERLLYNHTPFQYLTAFKSDESISTIYNWVKESQTGTIYRRPGLLADSDARWNTLRFCPECHAADLRRFGEGYWHRRHQAPGVWFCDKHRTPLLKVSVPNMRKNGDRFVPAVSTEIFPATVLAACSPLAKQQSLWIAEDTNFIYHEYARVRSAYRKHGGRFYDVFLPALQDRGLAAKDGKLRSEEFRQGFLDFFASDLMEAIHLSFDDTAPCPWIVSLMQNENSRNTHPLPYILMSRFLFGSLSKMIDAAESQASSGKATKLRTAYSRSIDFDQKRDTYRARWLSAYAKMPLAHHSEIRKAAESTYSWLHQFGYFRPTEIGGFHPTQNGYFRPTLCGVFRPTLTPLNIFANSLASRFR